MNSKKNAAIDPLVVPNDDMTDAGNKGVRTLILSIRFMREAEINDHQFSSHMLCRVFLPGHPAAGAMTCC
ncbi:MAG: hypothetical protein GZ085_13670 [Sulfuriferula multivorans]|uniref:Uncharacterized protein n=1 Tax=Sulfuriferula multivorans TaxID=1559896 RepID=A0A7C9TC00_9PROT|nr:hypothetical protein [Sulfuriferula multivorans]